MIEKKYQKINTVYKRDNKHKITDEFIEAVLLYGNLVYNGSEKIDGTNSRVEFIRSEEGLINIEFGGRKDGSEIPAGLLKHLEYEFGSGEAFRNAFGKEPIHVILYGEGYGAKIQKGGGLYRKDQGFILFDVDVKMDNGNFIALAQKDVEVVANKMGIPFSPVVFRGTVYEAIEFVKNGQMSVVSEEDKIAEGLVLKQKDGLLDRMGNRLMFKVKIKDFK